MTQHLLRHRKSCCHAAVTPRPVRKAERNILADVANLVAVLTGVGILPLNPIAAPVGHATSMTIVERMSDVEGLEEFGGLARWCNVVLRYPDGRTEPHRIIAVDGYLPSEFKRPLNGSRTVYETFVLTSTAVDVAVYEWRDIEER